MSNGNPVTTRLRGAMRGLWMIALWATLGTSAAFAQGRIQGTVTDASSGDPLPGANIILVESPTRGAATDADGAYTIPSVPNGTYTVRATYLGYSSAERRVTVSGQPVTVNLALTEGDVSLDDFVVTGYGVEIRREVTAAASSVRGEEIAGVPVQSVDQALQGRAAGVQITSVSGAPGAGIQIRVRGVGSINAGTTPLYIIDGVQVRSGNLSSQASGNLLNGLNPSDVESIEVLKDAAAVAIYGAQAANGVVLITTKRGADGPSRVEFTTSLGSVVDQKNLDILTSPEYARVLLDAEQNRRSFIGLPYTLVDKKKTLSDQGIDVSAATNDAEINAVLDQLPTYNWKDAVGRTGARRKGDLSLSGGARNTRFYLSGGAEYQEGQIIRSDFNRLSFRANVDHNPTRRFGVAVSVGASSTNQNGTSDGGNFTNSPIFQPFRQRPTDPVYNPDGSFNANIKGGTNVVQNATLEQRVNRQLQMTGSLRMTYQARTNLIFTALGGGDVVALRDRQFRPPEIRSVANVGGTGFEASREALNYNVSGTVNYFRNFGKSNFNVLGGTEYKRETEEQFSANANGYPVGVLGTFQSATNATSVAGFQTEYRTASLFSQAKYDFDNTYFLTGSLRYDGSSRFGDERRFGLFPSVSAAVDLAKMPFLNVKALDELKLRTSYGITGNSAISNFASRNLFGRGGSYGGASGIRQSQLGNANLGWEEAKQFDLGLDFSVFNSRLGGSVDYFNKINDELLLSRPLPTDAGVSSVSENVGSLRNNGLEVELRTLNLARAGFEWRTDFNISFINNEVRSLLPGQDTLASLGLYVGKPRDVYEMFEFAGINAADGRPMYYDKDGNITYSVVEADRSVQGDVIADYFGGINNTFSFKGLSLSAFVQYNVGQESFLQQQGYFLWDSSRLDNMERIAVDKAWRKPGDITEFPLLTSSTTLPGTSSIYTTFSTRLLDDASYLRLKTLTLSYAIPRSLLRTVRTRGAQIYFTGNNLLTVTNFRGFDPELTGTAAANYPQSRIYTFGLSLSL